MSHADRGAAVVEMIVVSTTALFLTFGALQLGLIGYAQVSADGAAYVAQHMSDIGTSGYSVPTAIYPTIGQSELSSTNLDPGAADQNYVDYNYAATSDRHGGASFTGAFRSETVVNHTAGFALPFVQMLGGAVIRGSSVSTLLSEAGPSWNLGGTTAPTLTNAQNYTGTNDHAVPYFLGRNAILRCGTLTLPGIPGTPATQWSPGIADVPPHPWQRCPDPLVYTYSSAEYLDSDNYGRPVAGVSPAGQATFYEIPCHQRYYARFAQILPGSLADWNTPERDNLRNRFASDGNLAVIRTWDVSQMPQGSPGGNPLRANSGC